MKKNPFPTKTDPLGIPSTDEKPLNTTFRSTGLEPFSGGQKAERCIVTHEGKEYVAWGGSVSPHIATGYFHDEGNQTFSIRTWGGDYMGPARVVSSWRISSSLTHWGDRLYQVEATIDGVRYTGRTQGTGMLWKGKRKAKQS